MPSWQSFVHIVKVGYSVFFEQVLMRVGFMLTAVMAAGQGTAAMAAHQVGMNIMGLSFSFGDGLQAAAVALIGRSLGEGDERLAKEYGSICRMLGMVISVCLVAIYFFGAEPLMRGDHYDRCPYHVCDHFCRHFPDFPGGLYGMPEGSRRYTLHSSCFDDQCDSDQNAGILSWRLCVWLWYYRYLDGCPWRPGIQIPVCLHQIPGREMDKD